MSVCIGRVPSLMMVRAQHIRRDSWCHPLAMNLLLQASRSVRFFVRLSAVNPSGIFDLQRGPGSAEYRILKVF